MKANDFDTVASSMLKSQLEDIITRIEDASIREMFAYAIHQHKTYEWGSQSRGRMLLAIAGMSSNALDVACSIEIWHNVSLMIDDLLDDSTNRRGNSSFWKRYSKDSAYTMSFYMDRIATKLLHDKELFSVARLFNDCTLRMASIEANGKSHLKTHEQYLHNSSSKTAQFYVSVSQAGRVIGCKDISDDFLGLIETAGMLHQFHDDIDDATKKHDSIKHRFQENRSNWLALPLTARNHLVNWASHSMKNLSDKLPEMINQIPFANKAGLEIIIGEIAGLDKKHEESPQVQIVTRNDYSLINATQAVS